MKLSSYMIGTIAARNPFSNWVSNHRTRAGEERSCQIRQEWVLENPQVTTDSCPKGTDLLFIEGTTLYDDSVFTNFRKRWSEANPSIEDSNFGTSGLIYDNDGTIISGDLDICACFVGCDTFTTCPDERGTDCDVSEWTTINICCSDWDAVALEHCPQEVAVEEAVSPCPSAECWTYDETTQSCEMVPACATLTCGATAFDVTFQSALFNLDANQSPVTLADGVISPEWDGAQWTSNLPIGENGMTYAVDVDENEITFSIKFAIIGNEMKARSDDVQDNVITLGSQSVVTTPFGAAVIFSCTYPMTVDVASKDYTVTGASVVDTINGSGSLAAGFTMTLNNGDATGFLLGANLPVEVTWSVTALSTLQFYLNECTVTHGTTPIKIVKNGCYSDKLAVVPNAAKQGFSYQVFKGVGETDPEQSILCSVNICEVGQCQNPTEDNQCPGDGDDYFYVYKV